MEINNERKKELREKAWKAAVKQYPEIAVFTTLPTEEDHRRSQYSMGYYQALLDKEEEQK